MRLVWQEQQMINDQVEMPQNVSSSSDQNKLERSHTRFSQLSTICEQVQSLPEWCTYRAPLNGLTLQLIDCPEKTCRCKTL
jgi:hypothetical protein